MRLSRKVLDAYNAAIKKQGDNAENAARKALEAWFEENPTATIAETREFSIALMGEVGSLYGNSAGDIAYALRDITAEAAGVELPPVDYEYAPEAEYIDKAAHYQARKLLVGDIQGFVDGIAEASRYFAERGANDTMAALGNADSKKFGKRVRFARVPTGVTTCPYCCMLASRGFVYKTGLTALNANHRHCDCRIVESFDGMTVEGYDKDEYYDRWMHPEKYNDKNDSTVTAGIEIKPSNDEHSNRKSERIRTVMAYEVHIPGLDDSRFIDRSEIESIYVFAGFGSEPYKELRAADRLSKEYGGNPEEWSHIAGDGWIFDPVDGRIRKAEIHWMEHPEQGMKEFWWKRWRET